MTDHYLQHVERGLSRLPQKFKSKPNTVAFLTLFLEEVQELEDAIYASGQFRLLSNAQGAYLDQWGKVLNLARAGLSDDTYRVRLQVALLLLRTSGTAPELVAIFQLLAPPPFIVRYLPAYPAGQVIFLDGAETDDGDSLVSILQSAKAGGIRSLLHWLTATPANSFVTAGGVGKGLQLTSDALGTGGRLSRIVG